MKFTNRDGKITLDGQGDLTIARRSYERDCAIHIDRDNDALPCHITNFNVQFLNQKTRLGRFWAVAKLAWRFSE